MLYKKYFSMIVDYINNNLYQNIISLKEYFFISNSVILEIKDSTYRTEKNIEHLLDILNKGCN